MPPGAVKVIVTVCGSPVTVTVSVEETGSGVKVKTSVTVLGSSVVVVCAVTRTRSEVAVALSVDVTASGVTVATVLPAGKVVSSVVPRTAGAGVRIAASVMVEVAVKVVKGVAETVGVLIM